MGSWEKTNFENWQFITVELYRYITIYMYQLKEREYVIKGERSN